MPPPKKIEPQFRKAKKTDTNILKCSKEICNGNLVIFPTETVYGIGASAMNAEAVQKIYKIKSSKS